MEETLRNKVLIREFNEQTDIEVVGKLEEDCEIGPNKGVSLCTKANGDPLCRIRSYHPHVMLVAELCENGELVGVVQGCIKHVGTAFGGMCVKMGCMLGLRVSPRHRRVGIGLKLIKSLEDWMSANGAEYILLATEKTNSAAINLFTRCSYMIFSSLIIYIHPVNFLPKELPHDIKIVKLHLDQATALYKSRLKDKDMYPTDINKILKDKLNLGTWVSYFKEELVEARSAEKNIDFFLLNEKNIDFTGRTPNSWVVFSIWNTCEAYKLQIKRTNTFGHFHSWLHCVRDKVLSCIKIPASDSRQEPFGFLFLYGLHGEGERAGELLQYIWIFAAKIALSVTGCNMIMTEVGIQDPLREYLPYKSGTNFINDIWCLKNMKGHDENEPVLGQSVGNVFVDPRDF